MYLVNRLRDLYEMSIPGTTEYVLSRFILLNMKKMDQISLTSIAKETAISKSAISKFLKKITFDEGYMQFVNSLDFELHHTFVEQQKLILDAEKIKNNHFLSDLCSEQDIDLLVNRLDKADKVIFSGNTQYKHSVDLLINTLLASGKDVKFSNWIYTQQQLEELQSLTNDDLLVIIDLNHTLYEYFILLNISVEMYKNIDNLNVPILFIGKPSYAQKGIEIIGLNNESNVYLNHTALDFFMSQVLSTYIKQKG